MFALRYWARLGCGAIGALMVLEACSSDAATGGADPSGASERDDAGVETADESDDGGRASSDAKPSDAKADRADAKSGDAATASDANIVDAAIDSPIGEVVGSDPCTANGTGVAAGWVTAGRCNARAARTPVVSSQLGTVMQSHTLASGASNFSQTLFAADGTAFVNTGVMAALDSVTLAPKWTRTTALTYPALGPDGTLYATGAQQVAGTLYAIDPITGQDKWVRSFTGKRGQFLVEPTGDIVLVQSDLPFSSIGLEAISPANAPLWSMSFGTYAATGKVESLVASTTGTVYAATSVGGVIAVSPTTHAKLWTTPVVTLLSIALDEPNDRIVYARDNGSTFAHPFAIGTMRASDGGGMAYGATIQPQTGCNGCTLSPLALGENDWVYAAYNGVLYGVRLGDPNAGWAATGLSSFGDSTPIVGGDGTVYVATQLQDGVYVCAFDGQTGADKFRKRVSTNMPDMYSIGTTISIDATGHIFASFATNLTVFRLGP